jgi:hypothetical protein
MSTRQKLAVELANPGPRGSLIRLSDARLLTESDGHADK